MNLIIGTSDGVWRSNGRPERIGLEGKNVVHVADRNGSAVAAVPGDGLYALGESEGERRLWEGDARASAIAADGSLYVGTEPAMVFRSDDRGGTWRRLSAIDQLPTRASWTFPPPPHEPHVRSIDFLPDDPASVLVGIEVGGVLLSRDRGETWREMNDGVYVDVHQVRPDPARPSRLLAVTGAGLYISEDQATTWQEVRVGQGEGYAVGVAFNADRAGEALIAVGDRPPGLNARVYHSVDGGHTWEQVVDPTLPDRYARVPVVLFAEGSASILTDRGQIFRADHPSGSWSLVSELHIPIHAASAGGSPSSVNYGYA
jgi:photosystem II stability/assembly factor-like uncharacterized protein